MCMVRGLTVVCGDGARAPWGVRADVLQLNEVSPGTPFRDLMRYTFDGLRLIDAWHQKEFTVAGDIPIAVYVCALDRLRANVVVTHAHWVRSLAFVAVFLTVKR